LADHQRNYFRRIATYMTTIPQRYRQTNRQLGLAIPHSAKLCAVTKC